MELGLGEDIERVKGKTPYGEACREALGHMSVLLGVNDAQTELYTGSDLRSCRFESNEEEQRFLGGVFRRTCLPEAEVALARQNLDDLADDAEWRLAPYARCFLPGL
jgi:hypothetical protein